MAMPLPSRPDWLRTNDRAAPIRSSTDFGGLKNEGQRGSGYVSPAAAPARPAALAPSERLESARPHAAAATTIVRKTTASSVTALAGFTSGSSWLGLTILKRCAEV